MRAVVTRVKEASVVIEGNVTGKIGQGFLILLGIGPEDTEAIADKMAEKICNCRVFEDENGKMNLRRGQTGAGGSPVRKIYGDLPRQRFCSGTRRIRRRHAGTFRKRRTGYAAV